MISEMLKEDAVKLFEASSTTENVGIAMRELACELNCAIMKAEVACGKARKSQHQSDKKDAWSSMLEVVKMALGEAFANELDCLADYI